jgi:thymidine phosphorylase
MVKTGDRVEAGQALLTVHAPDTARAAEAIAILEEAVTLGERAPAPRPLIIERVEAGEGTA